MPSCFVFSPTVALRITAFALALLGFTGPTNSWALTNNKPHHPLITGVSFVYEGNELAFSNVHRAGARIVHTPLRWGAVAPRKEPAAWQPANPNDPHYDWNSIDRWVTYATQLELTPLLQVRGAPVWAQRCAETTSFDAPCDPDPTALAHFTKAAALRYSGYFEGLPHVGLWQVLNEPNLSLFFNPQFKGGQLVSPYLYRQLVNAFYSAVKSVRASNLVIMAGLGPIARSRVTIGPMRFTRKLLCMAGRRSPRPTQGDCEGGVHFDVFDIHPYTTGGPRRRGGVDDVQLGDLTKLRELLAAADQAGRIKGRFRRTPLWVTEFSWDSRPPDPGGVAVPVLKRWTAEALYRAWREGIRRFFWFSLRDFAREPDTPFSVSLESGLYFRGDTVAEDRPKPHMYAFRFPFVAYSRPSGFYFWGRTPNSKGGRLLIQIRQGGGWRNAEVARADRHGIFEGVVRDGYGSKKRGAVRAVYRREYSVPFSLKPVRDFWQPPFGKPVAGS